jgi:hypothetical protein
MRNLLALVGTAVLTFVGLGWYLGWYKLEPAPSPTPGHQSVTIDIDARKINADVKKGEQKLENALEQAAKGDTAKSLAAPIKASPH